jgi:hypothetical protein
MFVLLASPSALAQAQTVNEKPTHKLFYEGKFLGIPVMKAQVKLHLDDNEYDAKVEFRAVGLAGFFVRSTVAARSRGLVEGNQLVSQLYTHVEEMPNKTRSVAIDRTGEAVRVSVEPRFGKLGEPPASETQIAEATDPLAGLLNLGLNGCTQSVGVFDSKRRYDLAVRVPATAQRDNQCTLGYQPIAGFDAEDLENPDQYRANVETELARLADGLTVVSRMRTRVSGFPVSVRLTRSEVAKD